MEKPVINFSFKQLITRFRVGEEGISPDTLWRLVLGGVVLGGCAISVVAYMTYVWATGIETPVATSTKSRDLFSLTELQEVIGVYQNKEQETKELERSAPRAPEYRKSSVPVTPPPAAPPAATSTVQPPAAVPTVPGTVN